jgi:hypothetical protein
VVGVVAGVDTPRVALVRPETPTLQHTLLVEPERREGLLDGGALGVDALDELGGGKVGRLADAGAGDVEVVDDLLAEIRFSQTSGRQMYFTAAPSYYLHARAHRAERDTPQ